MDFTVKTLGKCAFNSPLIFSTVDDDCAANYVSDDEAVYLNILTIRPHDAPADLLEKAGVRQKIFFEPKTVHAAIATCGGLCPGLNDVIRALVRTLSRYGVTRITGIQYGYQGFLDESIPTIPLTAQSVSQIHKFGGTILGTSRGGGNQTADIVNRLEKLGINQLFLIGGDGTLKGALAIAQEVEKKNLDISVVGIPKTIDNDISYIDKSFGFDTAVGKATEAVAAGHTEAASQNHGIGLIKLMGRESGFIAAQTAIASHETDFVLIPEVPFNMTGPTGFLVSLEKKLLKNNYTVVVTAEGAGQNLLNTEEGTDASGNKILGDIGLYLKDKITEYFKQKNIPINMKYIDPSYQIRASVAAPVDSVYCERLGNNAVHAAMAGKTSLIVGMVHQEFVHLPIAAVVSKRKKVDPEGVLWRDTLDATGQPLLML